MELRRARLFRDAIPASVILLGKCSCIYQQFTADSQRSTLGRGNHVQYQAAMEQPSTMPRLWRVG